MAINLNLDPLTVMDLILCVFILIIGYLGYHKKRSEVPLLIAIAFGLLGLSYLVMVLGFENVEMLTFVARLIGYLVVVFALYKYLI
ncbi:hypothetical protein CUJ83_12745 [Methanocella sp. CWC-04]|uniref:Uncharacterized protein n=1 Tax=Methanooceanicella nereidis TaxID=2052831 RepID=A0AAP2RDX0_9EURY|nr:hypothetical protein [Methanocella sp. CWC-04]MCD1295864.1 hypothetical protein [Methanocella sp. CWC-04]